MINLLKMTKLVFLCLLEFIIVCYGDIPSFIKPCKLSDEACLLSSAQAAVPFFTSGLQKFGIPVEPAEPLKLDNVKTEDRGLKLQFRDLTITGMSKCKLTKVKFSRISSMGFEVECPITATGKYNASGRLLIVPIEGDGDFELKTDKIKITMKVKLDFIEGADGKKRFNIVSYKHSYEVIERAYMKFENLFNGNKVLAQPVNDILNESWRELLLTFGEPIIAQLITKEKDLINDFLHAVPAEGLYLE